ncbi:hypothetical protein BGZ76_001018 [Entomortierella beljakovae]|nr:hypothetical protein BGZ76_001018 [Entomortierella beljakovae]
MPTSSNRNELSSQLQTMDSFLDMASELNLVDSDSNDTSLQILQQPNSIATAQLVLDISSTMDRLSELLDKLSQPRPAQYIVMNYQYQKDFVELLNKIQGEVPKLQENLDSIKWKDRFLGSSGELEQLESALNELTELLQHQTELADTTERLQSNLKGVLNRTK